MNNQSIPMAVPVGSASQNYATATPVGNANAMPVGMVAAMPVGNATAMPVGTSGSIAVAEQAQSLNVNSLEERLVMFYSTHNPSKLNNGADIRAIAQQYKYNEPLLQANLVKTYGVGLDSYRAAPVARAQYVNGAVPAQRMQRAQTTYVAQSGQGANNSYNSGYNAGRRNANDDAASGAASGLLGICCLCCCLDMMM